MYSGEGQGPPFVETPCAELGGGAPASCPSFYDVLDVLVDPERGNCTSLGCHGAEDNAAQGIFLPVADPQQFYEGLLDADGTVGRPYVVADDADTAENEALASWMVCSLRGERGGGYPMPVPAGMPDPTDVEVVEDWIRCGAQPPQQCPAVATDTACVACAKESCCAKIVQCAADTECSVCLTCIQTMGDPVACAASCDREQARVEALFGCAAGLCAMDCPGLEP